MIELIVFDVDGTLAVAYQLDLLPGVKGFFHLVFHSDCAVHLKIAIATNQGGVGMRYWMESSGFGKPEKYPTQSDIEDRIRGLLTAIGTDPSLPVYVSYRYRTRKGSLAPVPPEESENPRWSSEWRKPLPGMLLQAMTDAGVSPQETLFVGDSQDDQGAAKAAGCHFQWARDFFDKEWSRCADLEALLGA